MDAEKLRELTDGRATLNPDGSVEYPLMWPVETTIGKGENARTERLDSVVIKRPKGKQARLSDRAGSEQSRGLLMVSSLTGLRPDQVDELDMADIHTMSEIVDAFLPSGPPTGETS
ncbi:MAG: phage tail assembly protein [Caulobacteraceae bacterium]